ncbi:predicted protein [Streptomyces viridochromogenes DSM 40736]|uniref:Predicted protein n=1 Tax=Streptomyces viridochromogenes (strain DSM 40736 / JCM 4977 / BCRC 1201 / Tue 494) TaxID=591159 RepID=D9X566_STRVT|nr:hypothetical protein [Streptomyces viridochromogenes]EFL31804.1 predicted protein [Streptomyces viridochromogenes DSM 40736]
MHFDLHNNHSQGGNRMSDNAQLAQTGLGTVVIGGTAYYVGGWMIAAAAAAVIAGVVLIRFGFRRGRSVGDE